MFELLQLLHPLLNDVLDFRLSDHQDFLLEEHDKRNFREQSSDADADAYFFDVALVVVFFSPVIMKINLKKR